MEHRRDIWFPLSSFFLPLVLSGFRPEQPSAGAGQGALIVTSPSLSPQGLGPRPPLSRLCAVVDVTIFFCPVSPLPLGLDPRGPLLLGNLTDRFGPDRDAATDGDRYRSAPIAIVFMKNFFAVRFVISGPVG